MKEYLLTLLQGSPLQPIEARNITREYLQALILQSLQRAGAMLSLAFHGGTALRFLYSLPRYSEDLDFALEVNRGLFDFRSVLQAIQKELTVQGYNINLKVSDEKTVKSAFIRFTGLLYELNLSPQQGEILAVKIEVDTNPPQGARLDTTLVRRHVLLNLHHHDKASLLAGKLHAILQRPYPKGRDIYDLIWYLSDRSWPTPNLEMLNNALGQTGWTYPILTGSNWRDITCERVEVISWDYLLSDIRPFIQADQDIELLTKENLVKLLSEN